MTSQVYMKCDHLRCIYFCIDLPGSFSSSLSHIIHISNEINTNKTYFFHGTPIFIYNGIICLGLQLCQVASGSIIWCSEFYKYGIYKHLAICKYVNTYAQSGLHIIIFRYYSSIHVQVGGQVMRSMATTLLVFSNMCKLKYPCIRMGVNHFCSTNSDLDDSR